MWKTSRAVSIAAGAVLLVATAPALAGLGESADSIDRDRQALKAPAAQVRESQGYTVHEVDGGGAMVREFVSPSGVVFAVAWDGRRVPDLSKLLGGYAGEYSEAKKRHVRVHGRRSSQISSDHLIVESGGHAGSLHGRAYDPALLPSGVSLDEIR